MDFSEKTLFKNISQLPETLSLSIQSAEPIGKIHSTKSGQITIEVDGVFLHSRHDPDLESKRFANELPFDGEKRIYLLLGAGLGYILNHLLEKENIFVIWFETSLALLKISLQLFDVSNHLETGKLQIVADFENEDMIMEAFRGKGAYPITLVPHRGSFSWKPEEYGKLRYIAEQHFHKKDVNLATLTRFEKIWAKNLSFNLYDCIQMQPIHKLFGIAKGIKILVAGAGPSLYESIDDIKKYRDSFLFIAVDTALPVLQHFDIHPDLVYSVDPQALNSQYLESYDGPAILVFDPTSTYLSLRLELGPKKGFFTSSPFPLIRIIEDLGEQKIGEVLFGGSVSTNAASLASLMEADKVYLVGQDLSFTKGWAHSKGAILEERLNFLESRKFRREMHNYKQLFALTQKTVEGINGETYITNEKMLIFKKWFESQAKDHRWVNLTKFGAEIRGIPNESFAAAFQSSNPQSVLHVRNMVQNLVKDGSPYVNPSLLSSELLNIVQSLNEYLLPVKRGLQVSRMIYRQIQLNQIEPNRFQKDIKEMNEIDELVSSKKGLSEMLSLGIQRVILSITEGYDEKLNPDERANPQLGIAKKSVLLYEGLYESIHSTRKHLKKTLLRIQNERD
ncbi:hypothetical protein LPTSP4_26410 [Leptospira ryugenii]|uniref:6-hydroxymethylpterin diphosphokinase MptE-like domain-containing protein n=1 Tax=Leptospira ryugenii TaxID=1917863 RepID=A0A2P2E2L8_9LEPT|nr:6-hydroxymethylpterin diphosphokinase MptE-like protein [Leptospira ryugenii]GBF51110.1 hypothetical protein LPTSP4_26410 [Leptospira ryugenii]